MSHHFSPEFTVLPVGKEPVSKKLQRNNEQTSSARQREIQKLDFDNKQMEWKLNQLKQAMSKEKEDRGKQTNIWKSGSAKIESHSRNILGRTVSATVNGTRKTSPKSGPKSAPKSKAQKVKILRDEPLDLPQRDSSTKELIQKLKSDVPPPAEEPQRVRREQIETPRRREYWIHFSIDRNTTEVFELQSDFDGNLQLSTIQAMEPTAVGIYFIKWGRKRLLIAADGVIRKPKTGWGDEIYYPYVARTLPEMPIRPEPPLRNVSNLPPSPEPKEQNSVGGLLLQGSFDEAKNAVSFQKALNEWRQGKKENDERKKYPEMSVHVAQCDQEPFEVKFSETSTLTYMERVLVQNHRSSQIPPMPKSLTDAVNDHLDNGDSENAVVFTEEEEEERRRYRELFSPEPVIDGFSSQNVSISEIDDETDMDTTDQCIVEESPPESPVPKSTILSNTVMIEEISYVIENDSSPIIAEAKNNDENISFSRKKKVENFPEMNEVESNNFEKNVAVMKRDRKDQKREKSKLRSNSARLVNDENAKKSIQKSAEKRSKTSFDGILSNENTEKNNVGISQSLSSIVHEIGKIPINPDAIYHRGLNEFFGDENATEKDDFLMKSTVENVSTESKMADNSKTWNPVSSVVGQTPLPPNVSPVADFTEKISPAEESERYDDNSTDNESADETALADLEWELASRTGNVTSDGRISRLIDEWSQEDGLEIIDDPGVGSGLSTPSVRSNCVSRVSVADPNDPQMQYDFQNMEHMIMADLSDEYSDEEL